MDSGFYRLFKRGLLWIGVLIISGWVSVQAHGVQVAYCTSCEGELRVYVEHWHGNDDGSDTDMDIEVCENGSCNTITSEPGGSVWDTEIGGLPNCRNAPTVFGSCDPGCGSCCADECDDWYFYDFPDVNCGSTVKITIYSGNTVHTTEACDTLYPASTGEFTLECGSATADFTATTVCEGNQTDFTDQSSPSSNISSWNWDFGDGNSSTAQNPSHTYGDGGTYNATLTVNDPAICPDDTTKSVTVHHKPTPDFSATEVCEGNATNFTDQSTIASGSITGYAWDVNNDGTTDYTSANPSHTYPSAGTYTVNLEVTSDQGCTAQTSKDVTVNPNPVADFSATTVCQGDTTDFTDQSTISSGSITGYAWDVNNDGTTDYTSTNPSHPYPSSGSHTVNLQVTSDQGCTDQISKSVSVYENPVADAGPDTSLCAGQPAQIGGGPTATNGTSPYSYSWTPTDSLSDPTVANPTATATDTTTYTVQVTDSNNCTDSDSLTYNAQPSVNAEAGLDKEMCPDGSRTIGGSPTANSGISPYTYDWTPDDSLDCDNCPNPSASPDSTTTYVVSVNDVNDCPDLDTMTLTVHRRPNLNFTADTPCVSYPNNFQNLSPDSGKIVSWNWDFGDGSGTSTIEDPTYTYASCDSYSVQLTATDTNNCRDSITKSPVRVYCAPTADFKADTPCVDYTMNFSDESSSNVSQWTWEFGNDSTATGENPTNIYHVCGQHNPQLTVSTSQGCLDSVTKPVKVNCQPIADFENNIPCGGYPVNYRDSSKDNIQQWNWNFGDGATSTQRNPSHIFPDCGQDTTQLIVTDENTCRDTTRKTVMVNCRPKAMFTVDSVCQETPTPFQDQTQNGTGNVRSWDWKFGDGDDAIGSSPDHLYDTCGTYQVTLISGDDEGCSDTITKPVKVHCLPHPDFTYEPSKPSLVNNTVQFEDLSTSRSPLIGWYWEFAQVDTGMGPNPTETFPDTGDYVVQLTAENQFGCQQKTQQIITVKCRSDLNQGFFMPNAFSPDNDGVNDEFGPVGVLKCVKEYQMKIWSRWGELIYRTNDKMDTWNGKRHGDGNPVPDGVYIYSITFSDFTGESYTYQGFVTVTKGFGE